MANGDKRHGVVAYSPEGGVITTDATVTTLMTWAVPTSFRGILEIQVIGTKTTAQSYYGIVARALVANQGGTAAVNGFPSADEHDPDNIGAVSIDTDGANVVRVRVTGTAATNIRWNGVMFALVHEQSISG